MTFNLPDPIETERVIVRVVQAADLPAVLSVHANDEVTRYLPYATWNDMVDADQWYARVQGRHADQSAMQFVIEERRSRKVIGICLLFNLDVDSRRAEVGYALDREYWGAGYMCEALSALLAYGFGPMHLRRVEAVVDPRNAGSGQLLLRLGFTREGLLRQRAVMKGEVRDSEFYGLLSNEWALKNIRRE
jgi:ribosomal-protein-alanine N-acetyltransferase